MIKVGIFLNVPPEGGGAFQYAQCILEATQKLNYQITVFYTDLRWAQFLKELAIESHFIKYRRSTFYFQLIYRKIGLPVSIFRALFSSLFYEFRTLSSADVDLFIFPGQDPESYLLKLKTISTIHDLMHIYEPHYSELSSTRIRNYHYQNMIKYCEIIMVDSSLGKQHVLTNYEVTGDKIKIVPFIAPHYVRNFKKTIDLKPRIKGKYLFYPAQFWSHKNHITVLKAFQRIKNPEIKLVFSGAQKNAYNEIIQFIDEHNLKNKVEILGYISEDDMLNLYYFAQCIVFASVCGPTNIPPVEAIMLGKPLLCSDKYAMREQCGDAALYFDPLSVDELESLINNIVGDTDLRFELAQKALLHSCLFTVDELSRNLKLVIETAR
ncbi:glycosyltransferase family 4 protein [Amylibacter sp.]|nr:glycosyltransferase family 4 protein [Amylibacter sp.]MDB9785461.1 glycosyltransferase family 4 protein [Amylibacter sp.]